MNALGVSTWTKGEVGPLIIIAAIIEIALKGYAMWYAARNDQKGWFVAILAINSVGILPLVYLFFFRPKTGGSSKKTSKRKK